MDRLLRHRREAATEKDIIELAKRRPDLIRELLRNEPSIGDLRAIAAWNAALDEFNRLLTNETHFGQQVAVASRKSPEEVWQNFFEANRWIFGYGLQYIVTKGLDDDGPLMRALARGSQTGPGQVPDAQVKTLGAIKALCLVEIKTHLTPLLRPGRKGGGGFHVSPELSDAVSQCQNQVRMAEKKFGEVFQPRDENNYPTTPDLVHVCRPRSILVIGNLSEFKNAHGEAVERYNTFEMYRRSLVTPEIVTFDELYERASFIVQRETEDLEHEAEDPIPF